MHYIPAVKLYGEYEFDKRILALSDNEVINAYEDSFGEGWKISEKFRALGLQEELIKRYRFLKNVLIRVFDSDEELGTVRDFNPDYGDKRR